MTPETTEEPQRPGVSYVMPVLNEAGYIREAVASILAQDYDGEKEIVLALGPSADSTTAIVEQLHAEDPRVRFVHNPRGRTPIALNLAIKASRYPVVIRVDAHSTLAPGYTRRGVETLFRTGASDVGGLMDARGRTPLQRAVAAAYHSPAGLGGAAYHSGAPEGPAESAYLGIFRREVFDEVGYYDESLWRAQDWELCLRIRNAGRTVWFDPQLRTVYYPRERLRDLRRQSYASGVWRGEIARRHREGKSRRHDLPPAMVVGVAAGVVSWFVRPAAPSRGTTAALALLRLAPLAYLGGVAAAAATAKSTLSPRERLLMLAVLPSIHFPWAVGFVRGRAAGAGSTLDKGRVRA